MRRGLAGQTDWRRKMRRPRSGGWMRTTHRARWGSRSWGRDRVLLEVHGQDEFDLVSRFNWKGGELRDRSVRRYTDQLIEFCVRIWIQGRSCSVEDRRELGVERVCEQVSRWNGRRCGHVEVEERVGFQRECMVGCWVSSGTGAVTVTLRDGYRLRL